MELKLISADRLRSILRYEPLTGHFIRLVGSGTAATGSVAGWLDRHGYWIIAVDGRKYRAHRLAVSFMTGEWPLADVDHIDGRRTENRWTNLRQASRSENNQNRAASPRGLTGVTWDCERSKWLAQIKLNSRNKFLGRFSSADEAHAAYVAAKQSLHSFQPTVRASIVVP